MDEFLGGCFGPNSSVHHAGDHPIKMCELQVGDKLLVLNGFATVKAIVAIFIPTEVLVFESGLELTPTQLVFHNFKSVQARDLPGVVATKMVDCIFKLVLHADNRLSKVLLVTDRECVTDEESVIDRIFGNLRDGKFIAKAVMFQEKICGFSLHSESCVLAEISSEF
jgi:hypothetical protein